MNGIEKSPCGRCSILCLCVPISILGRKSHEEPVHQTSSFMAEVIDLFIATHGISEMLLCKLGGPLDLKSVIKKKL